MKIDLKRKLFERYIITGILLLNLQRKPVISLEMQLIHSQEKGRDE